MVKDRVQKDIGPIEQLQDWYAIDWQITEQRVKNLRQRIFRATENAQWNKVRSLMKLMLRSRSNLLVSVRRVTQENQGKKTPGIDKQVALTPKARVKLVKQMSQYSAWKVQPARRVYIPKANGKQRPLGIVTIKNRVAQAVMKNALEPSWEARFEANSYGFRPGRSCQDAIEQCFCRLHRGCRDKWVLDADVEAAFDNICHDFIMQRLGKIPGRALIKEWLKAGYVEAEIFHATSSGVQQGGVISPLLANVALDGLDTLLKGRSGFIRYADDLVITAESREQIEAIKSVVETFLAERGLALNAKKTRIVSIDDGFNFLGFNVRRYKGKCLIKPQKEKVLAFVKELRTWLKHNKQIEAADVIRYLNPRLTGWANYYRHVVSKEVFSYVDAQVWKALWKWCLRRHPTKSKYWVRKKYFSIAGGKSWRFFANSRMTNGKPQVLYLTMIGEIPIERHRKIRGTASPDNPALQEYWHRRQQAASNRKQRRKQQVAERFSEAGGLS